jgi:excisionase family DNA binding protein
MANKLLLVSIKESARLLSVSPRTVSRYLAAGVLPYVKVGRRTLIKSSDLITFAANGVSVERLKAVKYGVGA